MMGRASKVLLIVILFASMLVSTTYSQDPELAETSGRNSREQTQSSRGQEIPNFFLKTTSVLIKVLLFVAILILSYGIVYMIFKNSIENDKSPINAFFISSTIWLITALIFGFICFGEYTYKVRKPANGILEHLSSINWIIWGLVTLAIVILIIVSSKSRISKSPKGE